MYPQLMIGISCLVCVTVLLVTRAGDAGKMRKSPPTGCYEQLGLGFVVVFFGSWNVLYLEQDVRFLCRNRLLECCVFQFLLRMHENFQGHGNVLWSSVGAI